MKAFFKKHRKMLLTIGAVIIFLTYVSKELIADHYKDVSSAIDSAQSLFIVCETFRVAPDTFANLGKLVLEKPDAMANDLDRVLRNEQAYVQGSLETTERLLRSMPSDEKLLERVNALHIKFSGEMIEMNAEYIRELDEKVIKGKTAEKRAFIIGKIELKYLLTTASASAESKKLAGEALENAERIKARAEQLYSMAKWASFVFYALGWMLSVIGILYGFEGMQAE